MPLLDTPNQINHHSNFVHNSKQTNHTTINGDKNQGIRTKQNLQESSYGSPINLPGMVEPEGTCVPSNIARLGHHYRQARPPRQGRSYSREKGKDNYQWYLNELMG
ncbi:unnamed protein product [Schistosoma curassoni]|uniref:Fork-head domain-containing protein n=1 Tax=Schistosoma curassoni TaxID=6186 RepID=A0A183KK48_9TREM|nr:unnamed protein product [Schistosoma curassoni]